MTGYGLVAIVNLLEDWNEKDYGFALYKEEYELLRTANLGNTLVVVNAGTEDRRILGKVKEILSVEEYGKNPTAQVVGVVKMDAYAKREEEEERINKIRRINCLIDKKLDELLKLADLVKEINKTRMQK